MPVRRDRFDRGQLVTWADEDKATVTGGRELFGDGPFKIAKVIDVPYESYAQWDPEGCPSNHYAMGHTQLVHIEGLAPNEYSGAFFKLAG